jgi:SAM-dependent methyltransferase
MKESVLEKIADAVSSAGANSSVDICCGSSVRGSFGIDLDIARLRAAKKPVVNADALKLPLKKACVDAAMCFQGLHHLKDPYRGMEEMARAGRKAIVFFEPLDVAATRLALALGIARAKEGNDKVQRLDPARTTAVLRSLGFNEVRVCRQWYFSQNAELARLVDRKPFSQAIQALMCMLNLFVPRFGNRALFVAERGRASKD